MSFRWRRRVDARAGRRVTTGGVDSLDRLLGRVKAQARGWMPVPVYRRLYESAAACGGGTIVEIGTYCGAATIALALGARNAGRPFEIVTADLLREGVGLGGASPEAKIAALNGTFSAFGVRESIRFVHGSARELIAAADPRDVRLLLLDGGGKIEEDFALLWERLAPDAAIVIDDISGAVAMRHRWRGAEINQKHRISKLLVERFAEAGMIEPQGALFGTGWYHKGKASPSPDEIRLGALPAYHELIRIRLTAGETWPLRSMLRWGAAKAPALARAWRRLRPARP